MIYVVSPYSPQDGETNAIMAVRYRQVMRFVAKNFGSRGKKEWLYSPILHCHEMAGKFVIPTSFDYWQEYDQHMLDLADELWVLMMPHWRASRGVRAETGYMTTTLGKPVRFFMLDGREIRAASDTGIGDWLFEVMQERAELVAKGK